MKHKPRAGIDIDGVLYRWENTARFLLKWRFGYQLGESTSWTYLKDHVSKSAWDWLWKEGVEKHGLFRHGNCYPGSFEALRLLSQQFEIVLITSRQNAAADTLAWVGYHRIPATEVHLVSSKSKTGVLCNWYLDDHGKNIEELENAGRLAFLWDRPWNQDCQAGIRISSWSELFGNLHRLLQATEEVA